MPGTISHNQTSSLDLGASGPRLGDFSVSSPSRTSNGVPRRDDGSILCLPIDILVTAWQLLNVSHDTALRRHIGVTREARESYA